MPKSPQGCKRHQYHADLPELDTQIERKQGGKKSALGHAQLAEYASKA